MDTDTCRKVSQLQVKHPYPADTDACGRMLKMDPNRRFDAGYPFSYPQVIRIRAMPYGRYTDLRDMSLYLRLIHHSSPIDAPAGICHI